MNAASKNAKRISARNSTPVSMAPPLPARDQHGRAEDFGKEATLGCQPIRAFAGFCHPLFLRNPLRSGARQPQSPRRGGHGHRPRPAGHFTSDVPGLIARDAGTRPGAAKNLRTALLHRVLGERPPLGAGVVEAKTLDRAAGCPPCRLTRSQTGADRTVAASASACRYGP
jgi:hypothetical protein